MRQFLELSCGSVALGVLGALAFEGVAGLAFAIAGGLVWSIVYTDLWWPTP